MAPHYYGQICVYLKVLFYHPTLYGWPRTCGRLLQGLFCVRTALVDIAV